MNLYLTTSTLQKEKVESVISKNDAVDVLPPLAFDKISIEKISVKKHISKKDFSRLKMYKRAILSRGFKNIFFVITEDLELNSKLYYYYKTFELSNENCVIRFEDMRKSQLKSGIGKPISIKNIKSSATDFLELSSYSLRHFLLHPLSKKINAPYFFGLPQLLLLSSASSIYDKQLKPPVGSDSLAVTLNFKDVNITSFVKESISLYAEAVEKLEQGDQLHVEKITEEEVALDPPKIFTLSSLIKKLCLLDDKSIRVSSLLKQLSFLFNKGYITNYLSNDNKITRSYAEYIKEKYISDQFEFATSVTPLADLEFSSRITGIVPLEFSPEKVNKLDTFSRLIYDLILERTASAICKPAIIKHKTARLTLNGKPICNLLLKKTKTANWLNCETTKIDSPNYSLLHKDSVLSVDEIINESQGFVFVTPYHLISEICDRVHSPFLLLETLKCLNNKFFINYKDGFMCFTSNFYTLYNSLNSNNFLANFAFDYCTLFEKVNNDYTQYVTSSNLIKKIFKLQSRHLNADHRLKHPCHSCAEGELLVTYDNDVVKWQCNSSTCKAVIDNSMAKPRYEAKKCPKCGSTLSRGVVDGKNSWVCVTSSGFFECDYIESSISK